MWALISMWALYDVRPYCKIIGQDYVWWWTIISTTVLNSFFNFFALFCFFQTEKPRDDILVTRSDLEPRSSSPNPPDRNRPGAVPLTGVFVNRLWICILVLVKLKWGFNANLLQSSGLWVIFSCTSVMCYTIYVKITWDTIRPSWSVYPMGLYLEGVVSWKILTLVTII